MPARIGPELVIFSDLDGTFLDHHSYSYGDALPAFHDCLSDGVPVIFCSSKTRAEMEVLLRELSAPDPFIAENGGAIYIPPNHFPFAVGSRIPLGAPYAFLTSLLDTVSRDLGTPIRAFHRMTTREIASETGLPGWKAELAKAREYDEAFTFSRGTTAAADRFLRAVERHGFRWTKGGRFHHVLGHSGKRPAVSILKSLYRRWNPAVQFAALGDSVNDTGMLAAVDAPILVRKPDGQYDAAVARSLPAVHHSPLPGPRGWTVSVKQLLQTSAAAFQKIDRRAAAPHRSVTYSFVSRARYSGGAYDIVERAPLLSGGAAGH